MSSLWARLSSPWCKTLGYALALSTTFEVLYFMKEWWFRRKRDAKLENNELQVIFFPDKTVACDAHFSYGCSNQNCWLSHTETSTMKLTKFISAAKRTLDICVYCIASQDLVDAVLKAQHNGILVRVVTDAEQAASQESQIGRFRADGIEVRTNTTSFYMHHKFVVVDGSSMLTGSFNWSRNAMLGNDENIIFINKHPIVNKYASLFETLWKKYEPGKLTQCFS